MASLWYCVVALLIATYAVLDGLDLGAGVLYLIAAKTSNERLRVLRAIGPPWDGNELWLLAAAGAVYFAFPRLYASITTGFYLPLALVLGLLILRGISIALRPAVHQSLAAQQFIDVFFGVSSALLAVLFGATLGNIVRGVPLDATGNFFEPLWRGLKLSSHTGLLDWYTLLIGIVALVTLTAHGSYYVALKTDADLSRRARGLAVLLWPIQFFLTFSALVATYFVRPEIMTNYDHHKIGLLIPLIIVASLAVMVWANPKGKAKVAFVASSLYIGFMLVGTAFALYPVLLPARDHRYDLTIQNSAANSYGLSAGLSWGSLAVVFALSCFVFVYRMSRCKVQSEEGG
jgi:cytochrome d ubiquinol oxidase subunit II